LSPLALVLLPLVAAGGSSAAQDSELAREHVRAVALQYKSAAWPAGTVREGIALASLTLDGWTGGELRSAAGLLERPFARTGARENETSFVVEARVSDTPGGAQEMLLTWLSGLSTDRTMPAVREWSIPVGDVGFLGPAGAGPRAIAWIAFVRDNVAVRVLATDPRKDPGLDLGTVATGIDAAILARKTLAAGATPSRPEITKLALASTTVVAGEKVALDLAVTDPAGGEAHLEWTIGGPGQGYVERSASGAYELHTTGPGAIVLTLEVTASTGTTASKSTELTVEDD
jgi:hypothetical protein